MADIIKIINANLFFNYLPRLASASSHLKLLLQR